MDALATSPELARVRELEAWLLPAFETFREVPLRHALFTHRTLRIDLIGIPKDDRFCDIALGFEVKGHDEWDIPSLARCLKQASDYVLGIIQPGFAPRDHDGKRVMAVFIYPPPSTCGMREGSRGGRDFLLGMAHIAGYHRVGTAGVAAGYHGYREVPFVSSCGEEHWTSSKGWWQNARNVLVGKRQIGSQRFSILNELG